MYSVRLSLDSVWNVGVKRGWWRGVRGGEVGLFVLGLAALGAVYEVDREAVRGGMVRKGVGWLRGEVEDGKGKGKENENENENENAEDENENNEKAE